MFVAAKALLAMTAFFYLWAWVAQAVRRWDARWGLALPGWTAVPGLVLIVLGGALAVACVGLFVVRGRGTPAPFDPPREFVAVGPYRLVRNPMYIGALAVLAGFGLLLHSGAILLFSLAWLALAHWFVVAYEEPALRRKFGATYEDYCRAVSRWLPLLVLAAGLAWAAEGKPDFSGEWKMNPAKSAFDPLPAPESRADRIEHRDPKLKITRRQTSRQGESVGEWSCVLDGSECLVSLTGTPLRLKTRARWEGEKLAFESAGTFGDQEVTIRENWSLAADRKSITIQRELRGREGSAHQTIVLEKQ
jgi:protein-S-isoprenylcysteine O-methyltransferase Ste14